MSDPRPHILSYERRSSRRRWPWVVVAAVASLLIGVSEVVWRGMVRSPPATTGLIETTNTYTGAGDILVAKRAAVFTLSPSTVVYDEDPARAKKLWADSLYVKVRSDTAAEYIGPASLGQGGEWRPFEPFLFLHERVSASGSRHILRIDAYRENFRDLCCLSYELWERFDDARPGLEGFAKAGETVRIFAGQADPDDRSHFWLDYEADGKPGTIDGWLTDNDTVKFEKRPATARPTTLVGSP